MAASRLNSRDRLLVKSLRLQRRHAQQLTAAGCRAQLVADGDPVMNVDCMDLASYDATVYQQMVSYPAEVMTIMDSEAQKLARQFQTEDDLMEDDEEGLGGLAVLVSGVLLCK